MDIACVRNTNHSQCDQDAHCLSFEFSSPHCSNLKVETGYLCLTEPIDLSELSNVTLSQLED
jgi:hypothetical protein